MTSMFISSLWDVKKATHYSRKVGDGSPVLWLSCSLQKIEVTGLAVIGSLSNDNGDGNENVISKYKFALF